MVTTRIAPRQSPCGLTCAPRRHRVDPIKLLDLIARVKAAAGETTPQGVMSKPEPSAKAG